MSDPILLALLRQLLRQGVLSDMDIGAMEADLEREGEADAARSVNITYVEACALEALDGGDMSKPEHTLHVEGQPIADQLMASCLCGWRTPVSFHEFPTRHLADAEIARLYREHA